MFRWTSNWNYHERISIKEYIPNNINPHVNSSRNIIKRVKNLYNLSSNRNKDNLISDKIGNSVKRSRSNKRDTCWKDSNKISNCLEISPKSQIDYQISIKRGSCIGCQIDHNRKRKSDRNSERSANLSIGSCNKVKNCRSWEASYRLKDKISGKTYLCRKR